MTPDPRPAGRKQPTLCLGHKHLCYLASARSPVQRDNEEFHLPQSNLHCPHKGHYRLSRTAPGTVWILYGNTKDPEIQSQTINSKPQHIFDLTTTT